MAKVLIIDDSASDAETAALKLSGFFEVASEPTLAGGLSRLSQEHYDAVLLDVGLPDSERSRTYLRVKHSKPDVAVVVFSGFDDPKFQEETIMQNASGYIVKGVGDVNPKSFAAQIRMAILTHQMCEVCRKTRDSMESSEPEI